MAGKTPCEHPASDTSVEVVDKLPDGTLVVEGTCGACAQTAGPEPLEVEYAPAPVPIGNRWFAMVEERGDLAVCGLCGHVIFPDLHATPVIAYIHDPDTGACIGQVDFCKECGVKVIEEDSNERA